MQTIRRTPPGRVAHRFQHFKEPVFNLLRSTWNFFESLMNHFCYFKDSFLIYLKQISSHLFIMLYNIFIILIICLLI
jgi:hypothetical protein